MHPLNCYVEKYIEKNTDHRLVFCNRRIKICMLILEVSLAHEWLQTKWRNIKRSNK